MLVTRKSNKNQSRLWTSNDFRASIKNK